MPHDVIMPALGMSQDSGLIVSWLKQPGDPVKAGDALMEVETDKATMEVEAQADGYLTGVRAKAGDNVPVGERVARITETADEPEEAEAEGEADDAPAPEGAAGTDAPEIQGQKVIMPALGMSQDTGRIISWQKAPGDQVAADDVLLEVETDKSAMEVPAGFDGYVAGLFAEAGEDVPVGDVIAIISDDKPEAPVSRSLSSAKPAAAPEKEAPPPDKVPAPQKAPAKDAVAAPKPSSGGRILASPKARRLAQERGLDLERLVREGVPQPFHVADLDTLAALPAEAVSPAGGPGAVSRRIVAEVAPAGLDDLLAWLGKELGRPVSRVAVLAAFAAAAIRPVSDETPLVVRAESFGKASFFVDPDRAGLGSGEPDPEAGAPAVILRDLSGGPVTSVHLGGEDVPVLTVTRSGDALVLTFEGSAGALSAEAAIAVLSGFAERVGEPLRHLL
ncbi:biotin/lipoyl-containing protein [Amorphus orientalis]|uniref:Pyruvate/2-oxoglutarate dehydrogenase complex dihydrolipoamide acyltransferase (E2) component n=1 Tax=Amorphus orientalis TaxID=649198 RepID=A0AAE3VSW0_9HYPH|nr:biotin/lipoyl-containing protein [Amorphus orientalis]MDQ0317809.1 pyruvate/2-oxoglutarate dehydrogenase complex dihydrolipoamide acyltransferase (E2) component [Amorphus orientalis]